jgi:hypothetical protein
LNFGPNDRHLLLDISSSSHYLLSLFFRSCSECWASGSDYDEATTKWWCKSCFFGLFFMDPLCSLCWQLGSERTLESLSSASRSYPYLLSHFLSILIIWYSAPHAQLNLSSSSFKCVKRLKGLRKCFWSIILIIRCISERYRIIM